MAFKCLSHWQSALINENEKVRRKEERKNSAGKLLPQARMQAASLLERTEHIINNDQRNWCDFLETRTFFFLPART